MPRFVIKRYVASAESGAFSRGQAAFHDVGLDLAERHRLKVAIDGYLVWVFSRLAFDLPPDDAPARPGDGRPPESTASGGPAADASLASIACSSAWGTSSRGTLGERIGLMMGVEEF